MPRHKHEDLFGRIASFSTLRVAARKAVKSKRKKPGASSFFANLERELLRLTRVARRHYRPGRYVEIMVRDPKQCLVSAAPFRDRVVHHALCAVICPIFEGGFIGNTFANRTGKGTHAAIRIYERHRDNHAHVLRADIFRYFPSIDHTILKAQFRRRIACERTLALTDTIVDGSNEQEPVELHFPDNDMFEPYRRRRGLPIGNLTSQFFANLYLDRFDHWVSEALGAPYVRYVDDLALFHDDPEVLADWRARSDRYLEGRRLRLHPRKTVILRTSEPSVFSRLRAAFRPAPWQQSRPGRRRLPEDNAARFRGRLRRLRDQWRAGTVTRADIEARIGAWIAHATLPIRSGSGRHCSRTAGSSRRRGSLAGALREDHPLLIDRVHHYPVMAHFSNPLHFGDYVRFRRHLHRRGQASGMCARDPEQTSVSLRRLNCCDQIYRHLRGRCYRRLAHALNYPACVFARLSWFLLITYWR